MKPARLCGASIFRCGECGTAVAGSRVRRGETCPRHDGAETVAGTCEKRLPAGTLKCSIHVGQAPAVVAKAAERSIDNDVRRLLDGQDLAAVTNPLAALAELLGEAKGLKDAFRQRVDELQRLTVTDQVGRQDAAPLLAAYERGLDRFGRLLVDAARLNLDERIIAIEIAAAESQAKQFVDVILPVLDLAPPELARVMRRALADRLRTVDSGEPFPLLPTDVPRYILAADHPTVDEPAPGPSLAVAQLAPPTPPSVTPTAAEPIDVASFQVEMPERPPSFRTAPNQPEVCYVVSTQSAPRPPSESDYLLPPTHRRHR